MALADTWHTRDLPVLEACVELADENPGIGGRLPQIAQRSGVSEDDVEVALRALRDDDLIEVHWMTGRGTRVPRVAGQARRLAGSWPSAETTADRLLSILDERVASAPEGSEQRGRWQNLRDGAAGVGRDVLVQIVAQAMTGRVPGM